MSEQYAYDNTRPAGNVPAHAIKPTTAVEHAFVVIAKAEEEADAAMLGLEEVIAALERRLNDVLEPVPQQADSAAITQPHGNYTDQPKRTNVALAARVEAVGEFISQRAGSVGNARQRLQDIINRCQL